MEKKFKLSGNTINFMGRTLYEIKALKTISCTVQIGDLGGWIEKEENLSQEGLCWLYNNAKVFDNAFVYGNAEVSESAIVCDDARVGDDVYINDNSCIYGKAQITDTAKVYDNACIYGNAKVFGNSVIRGNAKISGFAKIKDNSEIKENANILGLSIISGLSEIGSDTVINTKYEYNISDCIIDGYDALIESMGDYLCIKGFPEMDELKFFKTSDGDIYVNSRFVNGSIENFLNYFRNNSLYTEKEFDRLNKMIDFVRATIIK